MSARCPRRPGSRFQCRSGVCRVMKEVQVANIKCKIELKIIYHETREIHQDTYIVLVDVSPSTAGSKDRPLGWGKKGAQQRMGQTHRCSFL
jgi:hypothetical protein